MLLMMLNSECRVLLALSSVSQIVVHAYYNNGAANGTLSAALYDEDGTLRAGPTAFANRTTAGWGSVTFSGLTLTQSQLDTLTILINGNKGAGSTTDSVCLCNVR
jgi:hypothetical protein